MTLKFCGPPPHMYDFGGIHIPSYFTYFTRIPNQPITPPFPFFFSPSDRNWSSHTFDSDFGFLLTRHHPSQKTTPGCRNRKFLNMAKITTTGMIVPVPAVFAVEQNFGQRWFNFSELTPDVSIFWHNVCQFWKIDRSWFNFLTGTGSIFWPTMVQFLEIDTSYVNFLTPQRSIFWRRTVQLFDTCMTNHFAHPDKFDENR